MSYSHIFYYLFQNHGFKPKIIHSDYEASLALAIKDNKNIGDAFSIILQWLKGI